MCACGYPHAATSLETLINFDAAGAPVPGLAAEWKVDVANKTITMVLQKGASSTIVRISMPRSPSGPMRYIQCQESWDTLLDCEKMGVQIRDVRDEFKGAAFRDDDTKLMFTYDYENRHTLRVYGHNIKPRLWRKAKRLGVQIFDRVMATNPFRHSMYPSKRKSSTC